MPACPSTVPRSGAAASSRRVVDGFWLRRGLLARCLTPVAALYGGVLAMRRWLIRSGRWHVADCPVPVVVVGNLIVGGAGKTPTVLALVALLRSAGWTPGIVSRGHGRADVDEIIEVGPDSAVERAGDEPLLLRRRGGCPVVVGRNRVAAVAALHRRHPAVDIVVSDDGLQHWRLPRALQIVVFDERGVGNGWLLPAGPLREPFTADVPPRSLVLYNAPRASTSWPGALALRGIRGAVRLADWWRGDVARPAALDGLRAATGRLLAVAGIARPTRFFDALSALGLVFEPLAVADHFGFETLPWPTDASADVTVVVTEKDAIKLDPTRPGTGGVWVVPLDFALPAAFAAEVLARLRALPSPPSTA